MDQHRQRDTANAHSVEAILAESGTSFPYLAVLLMTTALAFWPALGNEFVSWDDLSNWVNNEQIRGFSGESLRWMWTSHLMGVWQPLAWMVAAVQCAAFGTGDLGALSRGVHAVNILLHAAASMLCYFVILRLLVWSAPRTAGLSAVGLKTAATLGALFFAVHPFRVEPVAWASGQPYVLAMIFCLASVWFYLRAAESGNRVWHLAAVASLALSLLCKSIAVPLVAVFLVLDYYPLRRIGGDTGCSMRRVIALSVEKLPYLALTVVSVCLAIWASLGNKAYPPDPILVKVLISSFGWMFYVTKTVIPLDLAAYYAKPFPFDTNDPAFNGAALALMAATIALFVLRRRAQWLWAVWVCYLLILAPVVGLVKHGGQLAADRYSYFSCVGWAVLVAAGAMHLWSAPFSVRSLRRVRVAVLVLGFAIAVGLGWMTSGYCRVWNNSVVLWESMAARNPDWSMGPYNLAKAYKQAGDRENAEAAYRRAIEIYPRYPEANVDLGNMLLERGDVTGAIGHYQTALQGERSFYMAYYNLHRAMLKKGDRIEALRYLKKAIAAAEKINDPRLSSWRQKLEAFETPAPEANFTPLRARHPDRR